MSKSTRNIAASVRQRLLNLARDRNEEYNALLVQFAIERFLYRLSRSAVADRFVLKGAMLFRVWTSDLHRPTRDLDLFGRGEATPEAVAESVRQIIATRVDDDGMSFDPDSITAEEIRETQEYGGIRVRLDAHLGDVRIVVQADVGFGDTIVPGPERKTFPTLLDHAAPELAIYPPESVVAEKLQAITVLGIANQGMRKVFQMTTDLVFTASRGLNLDQRVSRGRMLTHSNRKFHRCQTLIMTHRIFGRLIGVGSLIRNLIENLFQRVINYALLLRVASTHAEVGFLHLALRKTQI